MIEIKKLDQNDIGRWVIYKSDYSKWQPRPPESEYGRIKSWNNKYIFVVYKCANQWEDYQNYTGCSTRPENLEFYDKPIEGNYSGMEKCD